MSHRALYRQYRPATFSEMIGQEHITTILKNQVKSGTTAHAYLFAGTRGTGKTSAARILARAVNCEAPVDGEPCGRCRSCKISAGECADIIELDAASNTGVDDMRDIIEKARFMPLELKHKVYIIDEAHALSANAFNALLKTLEEPPAHVIFILATTEIQKVPATILSRCQRYDFTRIGPEDIAQRVEYIAGQEGLELTTGGAELISRLADGAMRDALSILDTCAGVTAKIDADVVRRMAGVTDRSYLFHISDALEAQDGAAALAQLAALRQQSVDVKRLTEELIAHYRALMLAALPGGQSLLSGVSPEEEQQYLEKGPQLGQREAIRAIRALGNALEHMTRGSDQRIELELALFTLSEPPQAAAVPVAAMPVQAATPAAPVVRPFVAAPIQPAPQPFMSTPAAPVEPVAAPAVEKEPAPAPAAEPKAAVSDIPESPAPADEELPPPPDEPPVTESAPLPWDESTAPVTAPVPPVPEERPVESTAPAAPAPEYTADPALSRPRKVAAEGINPFEQWSEVVKLLQEKDPMLHSYLRKSKAYFDGTRVLIDGGKTFRDFIRVNKDSQRLIKKLIAQVSGVAVPIGPYEPRTAAKHTSNAEQSLHALEKLGLDVSIEDSAKKKYKQ